jgi:hypothetical protein
MNIDDLILTQPFNLLAGFFLILSMIIFSFNIARVCKFHSEQYFNILIFYILIILVSSSLLFFLSIIGFQKIILRYAVIFFALINILIFIKNFYLLKIDLKNFFLLILLIFFCLSLIPPLDADSLDYHLSGPIEILKYGQFVIPSDFYWLHFRLVNSGEMMTLLGLILGSDSFGQMIQFSGLVIILINFYYLTKKLDIKFNYFVFILSMPVLISLISSHKPFLFQSSLILTSLVLSYDIFYRYNVSKFLIIVALLQFAVISKISFIIQAFPIFIFIFYLSFKNNKLKKIFLPSTAILILITIPLLLKNYIIWGEPFTPFFHFEGHEKQEYINSWLYSLVTGEYLILFSNNIFSSLKNLIIPFKPAEYSQVLGFGLISFIFLFNKKIFKDIIKNNFQIFLILGMFFIFIFLIIIGKGRPRFFLEIYYILGILICLNYKNIIKGYKYLNYILCFQLFLNVLACILSIYLFLPGILSSKSYKEVMNKYSHQYEISNWINDNTSDDTIVLYNNLRSRHVIKRKLISYYPKDGDFDEFLKQKNINYVIFNNEIKTQYNYESLCLGYINKKIFKLNTKNFLRPSWEMELKIFKNNCN